MTTEATDADDDGVDQKEGALRVWHAARTSSGAEPEPHRVRRVREKLDDPAAQLVVVDRDGDPLGMALVEPFREGNGALGVRTGWGHISMVFVHPAHQGVGIGSQLLRRLIADARWTDLSVWTRESNARARHLYEAHGFRPTGELGAIGDGEPIQRWERAESVRPSGSSR